MDSKAKQIAKKSINKVKMYQSVFSGPDGEKVLLDLMRTHHMLGSTFDGDPRKTIFREGERNVVLRILSLLKVDAKLLQERIRLHENDME